MLLQYSPNGKPNIIEHKHVYCIIRIMHYKTSIKVLGFHLQPKPIIQLIFLIINNEYYTYYKYIL